MSKTLAFEGRFPVLRRERRIEKSSGSLSMKGMVRSEVEILEKKDFEPAKERVCLVVWKIWPPTSIVTMFEFES